MTKWILGVWCIQPQCSSKLKFLFQNYIQKESQSNFTKTQYHKKVNDLLETKYIKHS